MKKQISITRFSRSLILLAARIVPPIQHIPGIAIYENFRDDLQEQWLIDLEFIHKRHHKLIYALLRIPDAMNIRLTFGRYYDKSTCQRQPHGLNQHDVSAALKRPS